MLTNKTVVVERHNSMTSHGGFKARCGLRGLHRFKQDCTVATVGTTYNCIGKSERRQSEHANAKRTQHITAESNNRSMSKNDKTTRKHGGSRLTSGALPGTLGCGLASFSFVGIHSLVTPAHAAPRFCGVFALELTACTLAGKCHVISFGIHEDAGWCRSYCLAVYARQGCSDRRVGKQKLTCKICQCYPEGVDRKQSSDHGRRGRQGWAFCQHQSKLSCCVEEGSAACPCSRREGKVTFYEGTSLATSRGAWAWANKNGDGYENRHSRVTRPKEK
jgi:hypothetical protein